MANSGTAALLDDIIFDILCQLGVKDLLRFRCVSKPFCSLIEDPCFIKHHLCRSLKTNTNLSIIIRDHEHFFAVDFDSLKTATKLDNPLDVGDDGICNEILGCCNGLLALRKSLLEVCLWNPSTRKSYILPVAQIEYPPLSDVNRFKTFHTYGFGYEPISEDYKLVRMVQFKAKDPVTAVDMETEVRVYSFRTNSWRRIKGFPCRFKYYRPYGIGILANHALHWVVRRRTWSVIWSFVVAFDLGTEEYRVVPLPYGLGENVQGSVTALGGYLCLIAAYSVTDIIDIWIMKEYRVPEWWTKLISLKHPDDFLEDTTRRQHIWDYLNVLPFANLKSGHKLLLQQDKRDWDFHWFSKFLWYDLTN
ncbi:hypothetical protein PTKIN_Ptkin09bG0015200 [Pterospermum kingtungense]